MSEEHKLAHNHLDFQHLQDHAKLIEAVLTQNIIVSTKTTIQNSTFW